MDEPSGRVNADSNPHVLIIGAGVSGLLLAQGLKKNGISFSVFDKEESAAFDRSREWGMSIQWALPMLEELLPEHLHSRLQSASVDPHYVFPEEGNQMPVYNASTGIHIKYGREFRTLRADAEYESKVIAISKDGSSVTGDLIIAADGANSLVRESVFAGGQGEAHQVAYGGVNMHVCYKDAEVSRYLRSFLNPILAISVHPRGYWLWMSVQDVPDSERPEDWTFQLQWTWKLSPETEYLSDQDLGKLKAEAEVFAELWKTAWTKIPEGTRVPANRISVWHPMPITDPEFSGKVGLIGDATHAMSFHRGQGMNHGIADVLKLTQVWTDVQRGEKVLVDAVKEYEAEVVQRTGEEVNVSKMNTEMVHDWERLRESPFMLRGGDKNK